MATRALQPSRLESGHPARLWYGVLGAPSAWVVANAIDWFITARACADGDPAWRGLSAGAIRGVLLAVALLALAAAATGLLTAIGCWRDASNERSLNGHAGVAEYLSIAGMVFGVVFMLATAWAALPAAVVNLCEGAR